MGETSFLAPHGHTTWCFRTSANGHEAVTNLAVPPVTKWIKTGGTFIFVSRADPTVHFYSDHYRCMPLPPKSRPFDLAVWQQWLFVAAGGNKLLAASALDTDLNWRPLPCDKDIDALAIHNETLLAIDNVVTPKWLLRYELTEAGAKEPTRVMLPDHGSWETIHAAAFCDGRFAAISSTGGMSGHARHVWLLSCSTFEEMGHAYRFEGMIDFFKDEGFEPLMGAQDVALHGDIVAIAGGRYGLILTRVAAEPGDHIKSRRENYSGVLCDGFRQLWQTRSQKWPIVRVQACASPPGFIVTSIKHAPGSEPRNWEVAVRRKRASANSIFLPYDQADHLLRTMPAGALQE